MSIKKFKLTVVLHAVRAAAQRHRTSGAVLAGAALLVVGVVGLAGAWWACLLAGALLILWAFLDDLGRDQK